MLLSIAQIVDCTEAEGPGRRFAIWFQGCPLRCPGCCNPEFLPFSGGTQMPLEDVLVSLDRARLQHGLEGVTLLGGEPMATQHLPGALAIAQAARRRGLTVMVFTGLELWQAQRQAGGGAHLLAVTDILVDGPYDRQQPEPAPPVGRRWVGSRNQVVYHNRAGRFVSDEEAVRDEWRKANTLELRVNEGVLSVNGFPAGGAQMLWKPRIR